MSSPSNKSVMLWRYSEEKWVTIPRKTLAAFPTKKTEKGWKQDRVCGGVPDDWNCSKHEQSNIKNLVHPNKTKYTKWNRWIQLYRRRYVCIHTAVWFTVRFTQLFFLKQWCAHFQVRFYAKLARTTNCPDSIWQEEMTRVATVLNWGVLFLVSVNNDLNRSWPQQS